MKTRRSLRLEKSHCMQSILFPEKSNGTSIVPESPSSIKTSGVLQNGTAISVLETPDNNIPGNCITKVIEANASNRKDDEFDDSTIFESTPDLNLKKRKCIMSILESEYSFTKALKTREEKNSSMIPNANEINYSLKRSKRKSLAETILPFDLNNEKLLSKKLALININSNKQKSISSNLHKIKNCESPQIIQKRKTKRKSLLQCSKYSSETKSVGSLVNMSIENESIKLQVTGKDVKLDSENPNELDATALSFENSNLELTDANCCNEIHVESKKGKLYSTDIPLFNLSNTDDERESNIDEVFQNQVGYKNDSFRNFSTVSCKEYERGVRNKENSLFIENQTPISNFNRVLEGELSPANEAILNSQISLSPTQPVSILTLQGVFAFVDVRSGAENRSVAFKDVLLSLGAEVLNKFTMEVTHVIFRNGSNSTYQRAIQRRVHLVSPLWVDACKVKLVQVSESLFPISNEYLKKEHTSNLGIASFPRKLKSMQPRDINEELQVAEARMKRKKKLQNSSSTNSEEVYTPSFKGNSLNGLKDINSPLFGIGHLLTPTRDCRESISSTSSEKSSNEKEFRTPLATRMFNKYCSPRTFNLTSPPKRTRILCSPLHGQNKHELEIKKHKNCSDQVKVDSSSSLLISSLDNIPSKSVVTQLASVEVLSCSQKSLTSHQTNNCKGKSENTLEIDSSQNPREIQPSGKNDESQVNERFKNNALIVKGNPQKPVFKSNRKQSTEESHKIPRRSSRRLTVCNKKRDEGKGNFTRNLLNGESVELNKGGVLKNPSTSLLSHPSISSLAARRIRLHTVDVREPSQELIIPSTPPTPSRNRKGGVYDSLKPQVEFTQRKQLKQLKKKTNGELKYVPLPSTSKPGGKNSPKLTVKVKSKKLLSSRCNENDKSPKTPRRRFSVVPRERHSLEEFQRTPHSGRKRRNGSKGISPKSSLPSICITSVHSCNMNSVYAIIKSLGGFNLTADVDTNTTHVVCGSERRTINVLVGISRGCWVLDVCWLYESVELLRWAPEEPFELFNFCPGSRISRIIRQDNSEVFKPSLFMEVGRICVSELCSPPSYVIQDLLYNCGASLSSTQRSADVLVGTERIDSAIKQISVKWIFDSIQHWEVKNPDDYVL